MSAGPELPSRNLSVNKRSNRRIAVLGGGLQGCCIALALAQRGAAVHLYDRESDLLTRTAIVNEGKVHLGYVYAGDTSLATARTMITGASAFASFMEKYVGISPQRWERSGPFTYVVHRGSQRSSEDIAFHLQAVHDLVREGFSGRERAYFGIDLRAPLRRWASADRHATFNSSQISDAFDTPEIAIDPVHLAGALRARIAATPNIQLHLGRTVTIVENAGKQLCVASLGMEGQTRERYDHVVNALWDSRLAIDAGRDLRPLRPWLYRLKYGIRLRPPRGISLPSVTIVLGPFGDLVTYSEGTVYLSWYPACMLGSSNALTPPEWPLEPSASLAAAMTRESLAAMSDFLPALDGLDPETISNARVRGGVIVAWGDTDIVDPESELHQRHAIGVTSTGRYHSVDPGKLTMAPWFAMVVAGRIFG